MSLSGLPHLQALHRWPRDVLGYGHHQSLEDLRKSAVEAECALCVLILKSAEAVYAQLQELQPRMAAGSSHQYDWPTWNLFVVKRRDGGDGLWV